MTVLEQAATNYSEAVQSTPGLIDYYKLDEPAGPTILDSKGLSDGTITGGTFGLPGAIQPGTAVGFNGTSDSGAIPLNLSGTSQVTVEFWLKWNQYANNDALAMEFTPNFNENAGGFLVDPNSAEYGGTFGDRRSARAATATASSSSARARASGTTTRSCSTRARRRQREITPYVDGQPVSYQQESSNTGQGRSPTPRSTCSRATATPCSATARSTQLAIYNQALSADDGVQPLPRDQTSTCRWSRRSRRPPPAVTGQNVTFNASGSSDSQGTITDYKWDLDGSGKYATDTGSSADARARLHHARDIHRRVCRRPTAPASVARTTQTITITASSALDARADASSGASGNTLIARHHRLLRPAERATPAASP